MTPASGSGLSQAFQFAAKPVSGSLDWVQIVFNTTLQTAQGCLVLYHQDSGIIYLASDDGQSWSSPAVPGAAPIGNSYCTIDVASSSVQPNGAGVNIALAISFSTQWSGKQQFIWMSAEDTDQNKIAWPVVGTWSIP
jgi:hypothetical protein